VLFLHQAEDNLPFITQAKIELDLILELNNSAKTGAEVIFVGKIRNVNNDKEVLKLSYECHIEMANCMILNILNESIEKFNLEFAYAQHRVGELSIGDKAIVVLVQGKHREQSFDACRFIVDKIKFDVPIWKKEYWKDGTSNWGDNFGQNFSLNK